MTVNSFDLYNSSYSSFTDGPYEEIRKETYGEDLGQTGWMTARYLDDFITKMQLSRSSKVLEVGCGAGGCTLYLARQSGAAVTGIDINEHGIEAASQLAAAQELGSQVQFHRIDASTRLPFEDECFDVVFSNDAICHIANRGETLREWHRVLKPAARVLFTDALVLTGVLSNWELATRASIGNYFFLPPGVNEGLLEAAGFGSTVVEDLTFQAEVISKRWHEARSRRMAKLMLMEGQENFIGIQGFLDCVHVLSKERRLSRFSYLTHKA